MNLDRINYDAGVMFVFRGMNNSRLYTHPHPPQGCGCGMLL
jgi:hypothetical protein